MQSPINSFMIWGSDSLMYSKSVTPIYFRDVDGSMMQRYISLSGFTGITRNLFGGMEFNTSLWSPNVLIWCSIIIYIYIYIRK